MIIARIRYDTIKSVSNYYDDLGDMLCILCEEWCAGKSYKNNLSILEGYFKNNLDNSSTIHICKKCHTEYDDDIYEGQEIKFDDNNMFIINHIEKTNYNQL